MIDCSIPPMDANTMDVAAMKKFLLTVIVISASLLTQQRRKRMASTPKTFKVLLADGTTGRAVKLTARNDVTVFNWIDKGMHPGGFTEKRETVNKSGQFSNQRIMLAINGSKVIRAAYYDDWVLKTAKGFSIVKFDKVEKTIFFVDPADSDAVTKRDYRNWVKSLG